MNSFVAVRGYTDSLSYHPGQELTVHASAEKYVDLRLLRLWHSDAKEEDIPVSWEGGGALLE